MARRKNATSEETYRTRDEIAGEREELAPAAGSGKAALPDTTEVTEKSFGATEGMPPLPVSPELARTRERWYEVSEEIERLERNLGTLEAGSEEQDQALESLRPLRMELVALDKAIAGLLTGSADVNTAAPNNPPRITMDEQDLQAPAAGSAANPAAAQFLRIPLEELIPSPTNPRKHFEQSEIEALAANIRQQGLIEPIVVRPLQVLTFTFAHGAQEGFGPASREQCDAKIRERQEGIAKGTLSVERETPGVYEIVAGERRYRAHRWLNQLGAGFPEITQYDAIDCIVRDLTDRQVLEMQISENLQRADLTPLDWAAAYAAMVAEEQKAGESGAVGRVAARLGVSTSVVYQTMQLAKLIPEAATALRKEYITKNHAIDCARLTPEQQLEYLAEAFSLFQPEPGELERELEDGPERTESVRSMRQWIQDQFGDPEQAEDATEAESLDTFADAVESAAEQQRQGREMGLGSNQDISDEYEEDDNAAFDDLHQRHEAVGERPTSPEVKARKVREAEKSVRLQAFNQAIRAAHSAARAEKKLLSTEDLRSVALYVFSRVPGDYQVAL